MRCRAAAAARAGLSPPAAAPDGGGGPRWWQWALLALVDVEANTLVVAAYQYTTITSAMLLDCFTIPAVMLLSAALLGARYKRAHLVGALVCVAGLALAVLSDALRGGGGGGGAGGGASGAARRVYGDALCVGASILYACSNVAQERLVRTPAAAAAASTASPRSSRGSRSAARRSPARRRSRSSAARSRARARAARVGDAAARARGVGARARVGVRRRVALPRRARRRALQLSLLTSDAYAAAFAAVVARRALPLLYFVAFAVTALGLGMYHTAPPPTAWAGAPPPSRSSPSARRARRQARHTGLTQYKGHTTTGQIFGACKPT